jgi:hypothetical protein
LVVIPFSSCKKATDGNDKNFFVYHRRAVSIHTRPHQQWRKDYKERSAALIPKPHDNEIVAKRARLQKPAMGTFRRIMDTQNASNRVLEDCKIATLERGRQEALQASNGCARNQCGRGFHAELELEETGITWR